MEASPSVLPVLCNDTGMFVTAQVDNGCYSFAAVSEKLIQRLGLQRVALPRSRQVHTTGEAEDPRRQSGTSEILATFTVNFVTSVVNTEEQ